MFVCFFVAPVLRYSVQMVKLLWKWLLTSDIVISIQHICTGMKFKWEMPFVLRSPMAQSSVKIFSLQPRYLLESHWDEFNRWISMRSLSIYLILWNWFALFFFPQLWNIFHEPEWVEKSFNRSFENLNLDYIDMYLLHFPIAWQRVLKNESLPVDDVDSYELFPKDSDGMLMKPNI